MERLLGEFAPALRQPAWPTLIEVCLRPTARRSAGTTTRRIARLPSGRQRVLDRYSASFFQACCLSLGTTRRLHNLFPAIPVRGTQDKCGNSEQELLHISSRRRL